MGFLCNTLAAVVVIVSSESTIVLAQPRIPYSVLSVKDLFPSPSLEHDVSESAIGRRFFCLQLSDGHFCLEEAFLVQ